MKHGYGTPAIPDLPPEIAKGPVTPDKIEAARKAARPPAWRRAQFPEQAEPLYEFLLDDGQLVRREHRHYQVSRTGRGKSYRIYTAAGIKTKESGQLDRILNNHVWTFNPDPGKIIRLFHEKAAQDLARGCILEESARDLEYEVRRAERELALHGPV